MHRKHPQLYRSDHCYQVSIELSTCYRYGKHSTIVRITLTNPIWRGTCSIEHAYLSLAPTRQHVNHSHQHDARTRAETETQAPMPN